MFQVKENVETFNATHRTDVQSAEVQDAEVQDADVQDEVPAYDKLTDTERTEFWQHESRWKKTTVHEIWGALSQAVDLNAAYNKPEWNAYMRSVYTVACVATWTFCLAPTDSGEPRGDQKTAYESIRAAASNECPDRPPVEEVPTGASVHSRRRRRVNPTTRDLLDDIEV
jgi:hypothetical protein